MGEWIGLKMRRRHGYVCGTCGKTHEGFPTDEAWKLPDDVWAIPEPERSRRGKFDTDLCRMGDRHFIRCILCVPFLQRDGYFGWGAWAEVSEEDFFRYIDLYHSDARAEAPISGKLANLISSYADAANEAVTIQFGTSTERPKMRTSDDSQSWLAREQRDGMDEMRYHQVLHDIGVLDS